MPRLQRSIAHGQSRALTSSPCWKSRHAVDAALAPVQQEFRFGFRPLSRYRGPRQLRRVCHRWHLRTLWRWFQPINDTVVSHPLRPARPEASARNPVEGRRVRPGSNIRYHRFTTCRLARRRPNCQHLGPWPVDAFRQWPSAGTALQTSVGRVLEWHVVGRRVAERSR